MNDIVPAVKDRPPQARERRERPSLSKKSRRRFCFQRPPAEVSERRHRGRGLDARPAASGRGRCGRISTTSFAPVAVRQRGYPAARQHADRARRRAARTDPDSCAPCSES